MLDAARTHAIDRTQFGRPVASFQAVRHKLAESLVEDEFDLTIFQELPLDHGCNSPLTMLFPGAVKASSHPACGSMNLATSPGLGLPDEPVSSGSQECSGRRQNERSTCPPEG